MILVARSRSVRILDRVTAPVALVLPGRGYGHDHPGLYYTRMALSGRGWRVNPITWDNLPADPQTWPDYVLDVAREAMAAARPALVVGKSLGSLAMPLAAERGVDGVWLTPLLEVPAVARAAAQLSSRSVLVGGTADPSWDGEVARAAAAACGYEVLELDGADHCLDVADDPLASIESVRAVVTAVTRIAGFAADLT